MNSKILVEIPVVKLPTDVSAFESKISERFKDEISLVKTDNKNVLSFETDKKNEDDLAEIIVDYVSISRDCGGEVLSKTESFPVLKMSCVACASSSQNILSFLPGILSAKVNYASGKASIEFIPTLVNAEQMQSALQSMGYDLFIEDSQAPESQNNLEKIQDQQYSILKRDCIFSIILSIPLVAIGMFFMDMTYASFIMFLLATPILLLFGKRFFVGAYKQLKHKSANMDTLVALSTGVSYVFSLFNMIYPEFWESRGLEAHVYFEASGVIIAFVLLGKTLEERAKGKTGSAIKKLIGLQPNEVGLVMKDNSVKVIPISQVKIGDVLLARPGDRVAVDGLVAEGESFVDEAMITGESIPVEKIKGDKVLAGTINQKGSFRYVAEKIGSETLLANIIKAVEEAQGSKAPVQALVDKISSIFVPIVIAIAVISGLVWSFTGVENALVHGILSFVTVLVIACPCALGLATPTAIMVGIGKAAENGILIKDAESLEQIKNINTVVLDKTGTITEGKPDVMEIVWHVQNIDEYATKLYAIESLSDHPLADAILRNLKSYEKSIPNVKLENIAGKGVKAIVGDDKFLVSNIKLLEENNISLTNEQEAWALTEKNKARSIVYFACNDRLIAILSIADKIKSTSKQAISEMKAMGLNIVLLTGDNLEVAKSIADELGIADYKASVLPEDKLNYVKSLQEKDSIVAMVGDGINDSAALAQADVSIAMGSGSDIAIDVSKMTIISSDLMRLPTAIKLSRQTVRTIKQNLFFAFIYNLVAIPIAMGVLYPINGFLLNPMIAGAAMAMSSICVVTNSLLLKVKKL